jgi:hypothetical protein
VYHHAKCADIVIAKGTACIHLNGCLLSDTIALANKHTEALDIIQFSIPKDDKLSNKGITEDVLPKFTRLLSLKFPNHLVDKDEWRLSSIGSSPFVSLSKGQTPKYSHEKLGLCDLAWAFKTLGRVPL